ncbi:hypothetical protein NKH77_00225 [Streptomyces sp. M19]
MRLNPRVPDHTVPSAASSTFSGGEAVGDHPVLVTSRPGYDRPARTGSGGSSTSSTRICGSSTTSQATSPSSPRPAPSQQGLSAGSVTADLPSGAKAMLTKQERITADLVDSLAVGQVIRI